MASLIRLSSRWRYQQLEEGGRSGAKREERREGERGRRKGGRAVAANRTAVWRLGCKPRARTPGAAKEPRARACYFQGPWRENEDMCRWGILLTLQSASTLAENTYDNGVCFDMSPLLLLSEAVSFSSRVRFKSGAPTHWNQLTSVDEAWPLTECIYMGPRADLDADLLSGRLRRGNPAKVTTITLFGPESLAFDGGRSGPVHPASPTSRIILKWGGVVAGWTTSAYSGNYRCTCFRSNTCVRTDRSQLIRACRRELRAGPPRTQYATCNGEHVQEASGPSVPFEIRRPLHRRFVCRSCSSMASSTVDIDQLVVESNAYVH
uniref:Uncharacterized protein n=1 Tax=Oryza rufipogon TaxID=4529 RepID=A0A0E0N5S2_ORYRU